MDPSEFTRRWSKIAGWRAVGLLTLLLAGRSGMNGLPLLAAQASAPPDPNELCRYLGPTPDHSLLAYRSGDPTLSLWGDTALVACQRSPKGLVEPLISTSLSFHTTPQTSCAHLAEVRQKLGALARVRELAIGDGGIVAGIQEQHRWIAFCHGAFYAEVRYEGIDQGAQWNQALLNEAEALQRRLPATGFGNALSRVLEQEAGGRLPADAQGVHQRFVEVVRGLSDRLDGDVLSMLGSTAPYRAQVSQRVLRPDEAREKAPALVQKALSQLDYAILFSSFMGHDGLPAFPALRASVPVLVALAERGVKQDPGALTALDRYLELVLNQDTSMLRNRPGR